MNGIPIFPDKDVSRDSQVNGFNHHNSNNNFASTSSNPYPNFPQQSPSPFGNNSQIRPSQAQQMQPVNQPNQWPQMQMQNQNMQSHPQQHQNQQPVQVPQQMQTPQHFNPGQWGLPMPPPQFPNGMNMNGMGLMGMGMPPFPLPMFPQQMIQEALGLSAPVGSNDEPILIEALSNRRTRKESLKDALNGLHGKNGHSAILWKDYYLEHSDRLDAEVRKHSGSPAAKEKEEPKDTKPIIKAVKKPIIKPEPSPEPSISAVKRRGRPPAKSTTPQTQKSSASTSRTQSAPQVKSGRRSTNNSLTVDAPSYDHRMPPPNMEIRIPEPPSRSPTPPTKVVPSSRGNKFTPEDKEYFIKFISWRLKCDSDLSRNELCEMIAEKAPHGEEEDEDEEDESSEEEMPKKVRRPKYKDPSSDEDEDDEDAEGSDDDTEEEEEEESEEDDRSKLPKFDENAMGVSGGPFTDADLAITARYVSTFNDFSAVTNSEKWGPFAERYPQRAAKSWAEYFRRNEKAIMKLAKRIRKAGITTGSPHGRVSFDSGPPKAKRKFVADEDSKEEIVSKASKTTKD
ncbi:hypothetical protein VNI00_001762 [Paramarasmius palmivorus]|uniref:Uncharacterized protein n=1 Tax=Paramarasmius palmivorus TaxID=297713 RepID=A0AAW0E4W6_9AGAR